MRDFLHKFLVFVVALGFLTAPPSFVFAEPYSDWVGDLYVARERGEKDLERVLEDVDNILHAALRIKIASEIPADYKVEKFDLSFDEREERIQF